jgi:hypothetical protein
MYVTLGPQTLCQKRNIYKMPKVKHIKCQKQSKLKAKSEVFRMRKAKHRKCQKRSMLNAESKIILSACQKQNI